MRTYAKILFYAGIVLLATTGTVLPVNEEQSAEQLLQSGLYEEEIKGDLESAIMIYERISREFSSERRTVAKSLLRKGLCYERLGKQEALKAYSRIINEFTDQTEVVEIARSKLNALNGDALAMSTRQVWVPAKDAYAPSPDGRFVTYIAWNSGNLAIHDLETGEDRNITNAGTWEETVQFSDMSTWSPDSKQVAYCWFTGDVSDLRIVGLDNSKPRILVPVDPHRAHSAWPRDWSRDGKYILALLGKDRDPAVGRGHTDELVLVSVKDGSIRVLKDIGSDFTHYFKISPDGRYVVYDLEKKMGSNKRDIHILATDGSFDVKLIEHPADDWAPFWTPDGKQVVFVSNRSGTQSMWIVDVEEREAVGRPRMIKELGMQSSPLGFSEDGAFHFSVKKPASDIFTTRLDLATGEVLVPPKKVSLSYEGSNYSPFWSPDGEHLAYVSWRGHDGVVVFRDIKSGTERELKIKRKPYLNLHWRCRSMLQWSPDGKYILASGKDMSLPGSEKNQGLYIMDVQTGEVAAIPLKAVAMSEDNDELPTWPVFSSDGKKIYFIRGQEIVCLDVESHKEEQLYHSEEQVFRLATSPDGKQLAFLETGKDYLNPKLRTVPVSGGMAKTLFSLSGEKRLSACTGIWWINNGEQLLVGEGSRNGYKNQFWTVDFKRSESKLLEPKLEIHQFALNPNGQSVAFSCPESQNNEVWVLENFLKE